jgi:hypothetical protein
MEPSKKEKNNKKDEEIQKIECRMYENKFPKVDDLVMVSIYQNNSIHI